MKAALDTVMDEGWNLLWIKTEDYALHTVIDNGFLYTVEMKATLYTVISERCLHTTLLWMKAALDTRLYTALYTVMYESCTL